MRTLHIAILSMLLLFLSGCIDEKSVSIPSNIGSVTVKGDVDYIDIINCTVETNIFNKMEGYSEVFDGFLYTNNTMFYRVSGVARSKVNYTLSIVNITIRFYREEYKNMFLVYSQTYTKTMVKSHELWDFSVDFTRGKDGFGRIDKFDIRISVVE